MKFAIALLAVLATAGHTNAYRLPTAGTGELADDLQEFLDLLSINEIVDLTQRYLARDREFQLVMKYVQCDGVKQYLNDLDAMPEFAELLRFTYKSGLNVYGLLQSLKESLEMEPIVVSRASDRKITGGFYGYVKDLTDILPMQDIANIFEYKVITSKVFASFVNECLSDNYTSIFTSTFTNENFLDVLQQLEADGVDSETFQVYFLELLAIQVLMRQHV